VGAVGGKGLLIFLYSERAKKLGLVGAMVNPFMRGRNVAHRDFWPFYEVCADLGMAVGFHAAGGDAMDPVCHMQQF
jgi:predicted TIM-barrel fold metal-dependent hydrolase